jgi:hypothetical protein
MATEALSKNRWKIQKPMKNSKLEEEEEQQLEIEKHQDF